MPDKFFSDLNAAGYKWNKDDVFKFFDSLQAFADKNEQSMMKNDCSNFIHEQKKLIKQYASVLEELARRLGSNFVSICLYDYLNSRGVSEQQHFGRDGNFKDSLSLVLRYLPAPIVPLTYCTTRFKGPALDLILATKTLESLNNKRVHLIKKLCEYLTTVRNCYIIGTSGLIMDCLDKLIKTAFRHENPLHVKVVDYGNLSEPEDELRIYVGKAKQWDLINKETFIKEVENNNSKNMILLPTRLWSSLGIIVHRGVSDVIKEVHNKKTRNELNIVVVAPAGGFKLHHAMNRSDESVREAIELAGHYEYVEFKFLDSLIAV